MPPLCNVLPSMSTAAALDRAVPCLSEQRHLAAGTGCGSGPAAARSSPARREGLHASEARRHDARTQQHPQPSMLSSPTRHSPGLAQAASGRPALGEHAAGHVPAWLHASAAQPSPSGLSTASASCTSQMAQRAQTQHHMSMEGRSLGSRLQVRQPRFEQEPPHTQQAPIALPVHVAHGQTALKGARAADKDKRRPLTRGSFATTLRYGLLVGLV